VALGEAAGETEVGVAALPGGFTTPVALGWTEPGTFGGAVTTPSVGGRSTGRDLRRRPPHRPAVVQDRGGAGRARTAAARATSATTAGTPAPRWPSCRVRSRRHAEQRTALPRWRMPVSVRCPLDRRTRDAKVAREPRHCRYGRGRRFALGDQVADTDSIPGGRCRSDPAFVVSLFRRPRTFRRRAATDRGRGGMP
jgi:hypothetical protein